LSCQVFWKNHAQIEEFRKLKKTELLEVGQHLKLPVNLSQTNGEIKKVVVAYLRIYYLKRALEGTSVGGEQGLDLRD